MMHKLSDKSQIPHILVADDQVHVLETLAMLLEDQGYHTTLISEMDNILPSLRQQVVDLLLMDMNYRRDTTSGEDGLILLKQICELENPPPPIVVMTAWGSTTLAVEAMKLGANDFIEKPWDNQRLISILQTQLELSKQKQCNVRLNSIATLNPFPDHLVSESQAMKYVLELLQRVAASDANILLCGESGTGKNLLSRLIHQHSPVADMPFIHCNLGALSESVFESELFGHVKGAFTDAKKDRIGRFAMADGGSLFLDEIANTPLSLQRKLLQVIETGEFEALGSSVTTKVNVRVITASNVNFDKEIAEGRFREDLFYRINTVCIEVPPLRDRPDDILPLAQHYLAQHATKYRRDNLRFSEQALAQMAQYRWPGNVRELAHAIERAVLVSPTELIDIEHLGLSKASKNKGYEDMTLADAERSLIEHALQRQNGNISSAAEQLGLSRNALYRRLSKHRLVPVEVDDDD